MGCETELFLDDDDDDDDDDDVKFGKCDFWNDFWKCDVTFDFKSFENMVPIWDLNFTLKMNFDAEIFFCVLLLRNVSICEFDFDDATFNLYFWLS